MTRTTNTAREAAQAEQAQSVHPRPGGTRIPLYERFPDYGDLKY